MNADLFDFQENDGPLLLNFPHSGQVLPEDIASCLNETGKQQGDTDWHVPELYGFARGHVSWLGARLSRYVVDLNRDPSGASLYPGRAGTDICPQSDFAGNPVYLEGSVPTSAQIQARIDQYFTPYHDCLAAQITRIRARHGFCILLDCHSIKSQVPRLFDGVLPDLNLGTFGGVSCAPDLADLAKAALSEPGRFSFVDNGRFKGGWITRNYGRPIEGVHALQLEISQHCYMDEAADFAFDPARAAPLQRVLKNLINNLNSWTKK